jgi:hypothetical protein
VGLDAAILCSGASFRRFIERPRGHDLFVGVNRMAEDFACDWWVFGDGTAFEWYTPRQRGGRAPAVCTSRPIMDRLRRSEKISAQRIQTHRWLMVEELQQKCPPSAEWANYSLTIAMALASYLQADVITLYGCDWTGSLDWDGRKPPRGGRDQYRWNNERQKVDKVLLWLAGQGVSVRRLGVDGTLEELNEVAKQNKDEVAEPAQPVPGLPEPTAEPARHTMRLKRNFRIGAEELEAGTVMAAIDLYPPCTLNILSRGMEDGLIAKLE